MHQAADAGFILRLIPAVADRDPLRVVLIGGAWADLLNVKSEPFSCFTRKRTCASADAETGRGNVCAAAYQAAGR